MFKRRHPFVFDSKIAIWPQLTSIHPNDLKNSNISDIISPQLTSQVASWPWLTRYDLKIPIWPHLTWKIDPNWPDQLQIDPDLSKYDLFSNNSRASLGLDHNRRERSPDPADWSFCRQEMQRSKQRRVHSWSKLTPKFDPEISPNLPLTSVLTFKKFNSSLQHKKHSFAKYLFIFK